MKRRRKQGGTICQINGRWFLRYYERQNKNGTIERVKVSHCLGDVTTRGKSVPADIVDAAEAHMIEVNQSRIRPECTVTLAEFIENTHLPFVKANRRASTYRGYKQVWENHVKPLARSCSLKNVICAGRAELV